MSRLAGSFGLPVPAPTLCLACGAPVVARKPYPMADYIDVCHYDEDGRRHLHDTRGAGAGWVCRNGHEVRPRALCWCGWTSGSDDGRTYDVVAFHGEEVGTG